jgi:hypothetical protein
MGCKKKQTEEPKHPRPCRRCGETTRETYCASCKALFRAWLGGVEDRIFRLEWAMREVRQSGAST